MAFDAKTRRCMTMNEFLHSPVPFLVTVAKDDCRHSRSKVSPLFRCQCRPNYSLLPRAVQHKATVVLS